MLGGFCLRFKHHVWDSVFIKDRKSGRTPYNYDDNRSDHDYCAHCRDNINRNCQTDDIHYVPIACQVATMKMLPPVLLYKKVSQIAPANKPIRKPMT